MVAPLSFTFAVRFTILVKSVILFSYPEPYAPLSEIVFIFEFVQAFWYKPHSNNTCLPVTE